MRDEHHLDANVFKACEFADAGHEAAGADAAPAARQRVCIHRHRPILGLHRVNDGVAAVTRHIEQILHGLHKHTRQVHWLYVSSLQYGP